MRTSFCEHSKVKDCVCLRSDERCGCVLSHDMGCPFRDDSQCKYAALKASHAELMQMLSEQGTSRDDGDGLCWCGLTSMIPYRGHDLNCKAVEAALKKAEGLK